MSEIYVLRESEVRLKLSEGRQLYSTTPLNTPDSAVKVMTTVMKELPNEIACVINLDNKLRPINFSVIGIGDQNTCPVPVSNIYKSALLSGASFIMLLHNHPSGDLNPSQEDIATTRRMILAGNLMEIPLADHIIIGGVEGKWYSIRSNHSLELDFWEVPLGLSDILPDRNSKKHKGR